jgi:tape measure domain-containing protein
MAITAETLLVRLEATQSKFERQLASAERRANRSARGIESRFKQMNAGLTASFSKLGVAVGSVFAAGRSVQGAQQLIDASTRINNSLKVAGLSGAQLTTVYDALFQSAQRNAAPLESLVQLYSRVSLVQNELGISSQELIGFTDNIAVAMRVAGKSPQEMQGALLQLSQALGSGTVRAEEFNSILEGALPIAQAAAAGLEEAGGSVARLRQLVVDGRVSSETFFRAFEAGSVTLKDKISEAGLTVEQGFIKIRNSLTAAAGRFDEATDASGRIATALGDLAGIVDEVDFGNLVDEINNVVSYLDRGSNAANRFALRINDAIRQQLGLTKSTQMRIDQTFSAVDPLGGGRGDFSELQAALNEAVKGKETLITGQSNGPTSRVGQRTIKTVSLPPKKPPKKPTSSSGGKSSSQRESGFEREIAQMRERIALLSAETTALAGLNPLAADYTFQKEKATRAAALLAEAEKSGLAITPELRASIDALAGSYAQASIAADELAQGQRDIEQAAADMAALGKDILGGFISDLRSGASAADALRGALDKVIDRLSSNLLDRLFSGGFGGGGGRGGGLLGGFIIPGILHSGGVAGRDGYGHGRAVSPSVFAGARRYHSGGVAGMQPGEVPAILQRGEVVLPRGAKAGGRQSVVISQTINVNGTIGEREIASAIAAGNQSALARVPGISLQSVSNRNRRAPGSI